MIVREQGKVVSETAYAVTGSTDFENNVSFETVHP